jgi:uncharacterized protein (TIGR03086 family)
METKALFYRALTQADGTMEELTTNDFSRPTPDTEWNIKTLANHMLNELSWVPDLIQGKTIPEVGDKYDGDLIGDKPGENWLNASEKGREAVKEASLGDTAHLSYADVTVEDYIRQIAADLLIHSWDLAAALGIDRRLDQEAVEIVYADIIPEANKLQESGLYNPPLTVAPDADLQVKLLAIYGRDADWKAV